MFTLIISNLYSPQASKKIYPKKGLFFNLFRPKTKLKRRCRWLFFQCLVSPPSPQLLFVPWINFTLIRPFIQFVEATKYNLYYRELSPTIGKSRHNWSTRKRRQVRWRKSIFTAKMVLEQKAYIQYLSEWKNLKCCAMSVDLKGMRWSKWLWPLNSHPSIGATSCRNYSNQSV